MVCATVDLRKYLLTFQIILGTCLIATYSDQLLDFEEFILGWRHFAKDEQTQLNRTTPQNSVKKSGSDQILNVLIRYTLNLDHSLSRGSNAM